MHCGSQRVVKNGRTSYGKQVYLCRNCGVRSVRQYHSNRWQRELFQDYLFGKQTLGQLAKEYGKAKETIRRHLDCCKALRTNGETDRPMVLGIDCSFFGRGYGIIVARSPSLRQNLYWKEITTENTAVYQEARRYLEGAGFRIQAVVVDAKRGSKEVFSDFIVQICQYHQQQIIQRYLTLRPKTEAGRELKYITDSLTQQDEDSFAESIKAWQGKWDCFLKER